MITSTCNLCGFAVSGSSVAEIIRMGDEHLATHEPEAAPESGPVDRFAQRADLQ